MAEKFVDYYDVLKIPRSATQDEVKQAFRRLAREHHPDLHAEKDKDSHTRKMQQVNEAYSVLGSKDNRAKYDQLGEHWQEGAPPPPPQYSQPQEGPSGSFGGQNAEGFSDFFRHMFGQGMPGSRQAEPIPEELDIEAALEISLEDSVHGMEKTFSLMTTSLCPNCHGTGRVKQGYCPVCGGVGEIRKPREIKARIPAGLTDGARIRLKGQGHEGPNKTRGDLYLQIQLRPDPRFVIDGKNVETEIRVTPWQAALGAEVAAPTLDDSLRIRIPKGTHTGKRLRVAGKGLGKADARGDLFLRVIIDNPEKLSTKAEALMKQLEEEAHA